MKNLASPDKRRRGLFASHALGRFDQAENPVLESRQKERRVKSRAEGRTASRPSRICELPTGSSSGDWHDHPLHLFNQRGIKQELKNNYIAV